MCQLSNAHGRMLHTRGNGSVNPPTWKRSRFLTCTVIAMACSSIAFGAEPCRRIHGRARLYTGDGQLSIWHIGTHHIFSLGTNDGSWEMLLPYVGEHGENSLYADFTVCPYGPYVAGAAQSSKLIRIEHPHVEKWIAED